MINGQKILVEKRINKPQKYGKCFICGKEGHIARYCTSKMNLTIENDKKSRKRF
jgi:hypothetical protein